MLDKIKKGDAPKVSSEEFRSSSKEIINNTLNRKS